MAVMTRRTELYKMFPKEFDLVDELLEFLRVNFETEPATFPDDDIVKGVIYFFGAKSAKTFRAAKTLCEQGFGPEAFQLVRALSEIYASIRFIKEADSMKRATMYGEYEWVLKKQAWDKIMEHAPDAVPANRMPDRRVIEKEYERVCTTYKHFKNPRGALAWTDCGVQSLYRKYNLGFHADVFYPLASQQSHSLPTSASSYVSRQTSSDNEASAEWRTGPSPDMVKEALGTLSDMELRILDEVADTLGYDVEKPVRTIAEKISARAEESRQKRVRDKQQT